MHPATILLTLAGIAAFAICAIVERAVSHERRAERDRERLWRRIDAAVDAEVLDLAPYQLPAVRIGSDLSPSSGNLAGEAARLPGGSLEGRSHA